MKVKAIHTNYDDAPSNLSEWGSKKTRIRITQGMEYEVHAFSVFKGVVVLMIVDDLRIISWLPSWFFETAESSIPTDWVSWTYPDLDGLQLVVGPSFMAESEEAYDRMVELDEQQAEKFWRRLKSRGGDHPRY